MSIFQYKALLIRAHDSFQPLSEDIKALCHIFVDKLAIRMQTGVCTCSLNVLEHIFLLRNLLSLVNDHAAFKKVQKARRLFPLHNSDLQKRVNCYRNIPCVICCKVHVVVDPKSRRLILHELLKSFLFVN